MYCLRISFHFKYVVILTIKYVCRVKSGNPGYLVMFNTANMNITVNLKEFKDVPEELNVQVVSSNNPHVKGK